MKQVALKYFTDWDLSLLALVLFFVSFVFMIYRVYFYETRESIERLAQIPLNDEEKGNV